ncbi:MAG: hypothetical protein FWF54_09810 [Candidatus Azobacteroides sp.]|nr:hypothetical protein [Candidatus Azobacteroides sp.]
MKKILLVILFISGRCYAYAQIPAGTASTSTSSNGEEIYYNENGVRGIKNPPLSR